MFAGIAWARWRTRGDLQLPGIGAHVTRGVGEVAARARRTRHVPAAEEGEHVALHVGRQRVPVTRVVLRVAVVRPGGGGGGGGWVGGGGAGGRGGGGSGSGYGSRSRGGCSCGAAASGSCDAVWRQDAAVRGYSAGYGCRLHRGWRVGRQRGRGRGSQGLLRAEGATWQK